MSARIRAHERDGVGFLARLGLLIAFVLVLLIIGVVGCHSGWPGRKIAQLKEATLELTRLAHFEVKDIIVKGRNQSGKEEIVDALGTVRGAPIFGINMESAAEKLSGLPWVSSVIVERRLPDTMVVLLTERTPLARWQQNERFFVIDRQGQVLPTAKAEDFNDLPLVVGTGAEREAHVLLDILKSYPDIKEKTTASVRVGQRRWDLHLYPKIVVRLPEENLHTALQRLTSLMSKENILNRDIVAIDLRIPDRMAVEPAVGAKTGELKK